LAIAAAPLVGCTTPGSPDTPELKPLVMDPADPCYPQRQAFNASPHFMTDRIVTSAVVGTVAGAALGAGVAAMSHGSIVTGLAVGAGTGLVAALATGYLSTVQQKAANDQELSQQVNSDLTTESNSISDVTVSFARLRQCRFAQAAKIKQDLRRHRIDRAASQQLLDYQHDRFNEELAMAHAYGVNMARQADEFHNAADTLKKKNVPNDDQINRVATETIPEKRSNYDDGVNKAEANAQVAFNIDSNIPVSWLEEHYA
jgi:hypothetical protein